MLPTNQQIPEQASVMYVQNAAGLFVPLQLNGAGGLATSFTTPHEVVVTLTPTNGGSAYTASAQSIKGLMDVDCSGFAAANQWVDFASWVSVYNGITTGGAVVALMRVFQGTPNGATTAYTDGQQAVLDPADSGKLIARANASAINGGETNVSSYSFAGATNSPIQLDANAKFKAGLLTGGALVFASGARITNRFVLRV